MRLPAALLIPLALAAQTPPDNLCGISGTVVNAVTAEPLRHALIAIRRIDIGSGTTTIRVTSALYSDSSGNFAVSGIEPGTYRIFADHNGFLPAQYGARGPNKSGASLVLTAGQKSTDLRLSLYPQGVISGRILDEDGEPVPNAEVQVSRLQYMQGRKQLARSNSRTTDDLGEYRIFGLAPGHYYLSANYRSDPNAADAAAAAGQGQYVPTYHPRTADPAAAAPLDLAPGSQLRNIDVTLVRVRTVTVKGRITSEIPSDSAGQGNLSVILSAGSPLGVDGGAGRGAAVLPDGTFEFRNVAPGTYHLVAMASVPAKAYTARVPLQVGAANIEGIAITIHAPLNIAGQVKVEGDLPGNFTRIRVGVQPFEAAGAVFGPMPDLPIKPDGSFQLPDLSAEHYRVVVNALPDGFYVKSIRSANVDVQLAGLDLASGAAAPLSIVLSPNAGELTGTVLDPKTQKPVSAVTVVLVPQEKERRERESFYKTTPTDQVGRFTFKNIVPGDYKVFSWEDVPYGSWMDPEFLAPQESRGEPISIREGSPQSLQLNLIIDQ